MQRRSYHHRARIFDAAFLKPPAEARSSHSFRSPSPDRHPGRRTKRIFVVKQAIQLPPTNSAQGRNVQHILIFDDHPESLRLVFGKATPEIDLSGPPDASSRHLVLLSILIVGLLTAILWLFF